MQQVGDTCINPDKLQTAQPLHLTCGAIDLQGCAVKNQLTLQIGQGGPGQGPGWLNGFRDVGQRTVFDAGCYFEITWAGTAERNFIHQPFDLELDLAEVASLHRIAHIVAYAVWQDQGQIAVNPGAVSAAQAALQVQQTQRDLLQPGRLGRFTRRCKGRSRCGTPAGLGSALRIGTGKPDIAQLGVDFAVRLGPLRVHGQQVQGNVGVFKNTRQVQRTVDDFDRGLTARVGDVKLNRCPAEAGPARCRTQVLIGNGARHRPSTCKRRQLEPRDSTFRRKTDGCVGGALPPDIHRLHLALGRIGLDLGTRVGTQGHPSGDLCQRGQIQPVGLELCALLGGPNRIGVGDAEISARPAQALCRVKAQAFGMELKTSTQLAAAKPAFDGGQRQRFEGLAELDVHRRQRHICGATGDLPTVHIRPSPQASTAGCDRHAEAVQADVLVDAGHIDTPEVGVQLTRPVSP